MKKLLFALSFASITTATFAGSNDKTISLEKRLDTSIQNQVTFPRFLMEKEGEHTAEIHFKVNADGTIAVTDIVTDEPNLKENLMYQAKGFMVNTQGLDLNDTYKVVVRFNTVMGN